MLWSRESWIFKIAVEHSCCCSCRPSSWLVAQHRNVAPSPSQNYTTAINLCPGKLLCLHEVILKITVVVKHTWETKSTKRVTQSLSKWLDAVQAAWQPKCSWGFYSSVTQPTPVYRDAPRLAAVSALGLSLPAVGASSETPLAACLGASTGEHKISINK